jgi:DNA-binding beta-propeller fold protein YncE
MGDPFARVLRAADAPAAPRPEFADELLRRLLGELGEERPSEPVRPGTAPGGLSRPQPTASAASPAPFPRWRRDRPLWPLTTAALLVLVVTVGLATAWWLRLAPEHVVRTMPAAVGRIEFLWQSTGGPDVVVQPQGLAVAPDGNLWVVDAGNDRFQILAPDGTFLETWGESGSAAGRFDFSAGSGDGSVRGGWRRGDIAFAPDGSFFVADTGNHRIQKFAPDRSFLTSWGSEGEGDGQFLAAKNVAVGPDGSVYVCDEDRRDVQKFDAEGRFLGITGRYQEDGGKPSTADAVAVDGEGFVWVADQTNHRIARFNPAGEFLEAWGVRGTRPGEVFYPIDLAVDAAGLVYVIDRHVHRIQLFDRDGRFLAETRGDPANLERLFGIQTIAVGSNGAVYVGSDFIVQAYRAIVLTGDGLLP